MNRIQYHRPLQRIEQPLSLIIRKGNVADGMIGTLPVILIVEVVLILGLSAEPTEKRDANVAFHIFVPNGQQSAVSRLLDRIFHEENMFLIEYDAKIPSYEYLRLGPSRHQNVFQRRADIASPGGVTEVLNILDAIAFFLNLETFAGRQFDYFIPLTTSSYPTVPPAHIRSLLRTITASESSLSPSFFHFVHPSQLPLFASEIDTHVVDLALAFNASVSPELYTGRLPHPDRRRRTFALPRASPFFVISRAFAEFAVDSIGTKRLLLILAETANVRLRFFSALAVIANQSLVGPVIRTASLHCVDSTAIDTNTSRSLPNYFPRTPSVAFLMNTTRPCLFSAPFDSASSLSVMDDIDRQLLILPGTQGKPPGIAYYEIIREKLHSLLS